jgi:hypothetical protein
MSNPDRWENYINTLPWEPGQLDESTYRAFLRAASLGIPADTAFQVALERLRQSGGHIRRKKIEAQLNRAYAYTGAHANFRCAFQRTGMISSWPTPDYGLIQSITAIGPSLHDLLESSPVRFDDGEPHTEEIIDALFPGNPLLCAGYSNSVFRTMHREEWRGLLSLQQFIVPHPMSASTGKTRQGKLSAHTLENTGPFTYLVIEFDSGSIDSHAALLHYLGNRGPLVLATYSAGKSLHGWFACRKEPHETLRRFMAAAVRLGADKATWLNRSQFVRMPDGIRPAHGRQSVFYFNPELIK